MVVHHFPSRPPLATVMEYSQLRRCTAVLRPHTGVLQPVTAHATTDDRICYKGGDGELWRRRRCCDFAAASTGEATTGDRICCNQWGPSHGGGDHGPTVVTTTQWWCCNQFVFCYNQLHFLLLLSSNFTGNNHFFATAVLILLEPVSDFASTASCFCWIRRLMFLVLPCVCFLLEPVPHFLASTVCLFCWNRHRFLLPPLFWL